MDGRVARGERTRKAIVDAHTDLVREGVLKPTAQAVAERAGVSIRTFWSNFSDGEALLRATVQRWLELDSGWWTPVDPSLPLDERIALFCERRATRIEHMAPAARSAALSEPFSPALRDSWTHHVERLIGDLKHTFGAELAGGRGAARLPELVVLASWPAWRMLTEDLGRTRAEAIAVTADGFARILA